MEAKFSARQSMLGISECERLCSRSSRDVDVLAQLSGCPSVPGERFNVSVGTALNMLVLSIAQNNAVEPQAMAPWLPGLRNEALLILGQNIDNWSFDGTSAEDRAFWPALYGYGDAVRPRVARLLGVTTHGTICELYFYSQNDVVCFSKSKFNLDYRDSPPRFTIAAQALADKVRIIRSGPLFNAKAVNFA